MGFFSYRSMQIETDLDCVTQGAGRLVDSAYVLDSGLRLQQHSWQQYRHDAGKRESPAHFLHGSFAAGPLLAGAGAHYVDDGDRVGGPRGRSGVQILERHVAAIYFLVAQDAHQQFRREIVRHGSQPHAHHDGSRGHHQWSLPLAADLLPLPAQLAAYVGAGENRGLEVAARQLAAVASDGRDHLDQRVTDLGLLIGADRARGQIDARQMQRGHQHQIAIIRERILFEKNPRAGDDLSRIRRQRALIETLRHGQRLRIPEQNIEHVERLDVPSGNQETQSQRSRYDQADRAPQPAPEYRRNHHRQRRQARRMAVQLRFHQLPGNQLHHDEEPQGFQGQGPVRIDGGGQQYRTQRRYPHADVGNEAQHSGQRRPEQRMRQADDGESHPDREPEPDVDGELRHEKTRQTLPRIIDREGGPADIGAPGNADEAISQCLVLQQHEYQHDQHDTRRLDRHPDRSENPFDDLQGIERGLVQLHRNRSGARLGQQQKPGLIEIFWLAQSRRLPPRAWMLLSL